MQHHQPEPLSDDQRKALDHMLLGPQDLTQDVLTTLRRTDPPTPTPEPGPTGRFPDGELTPEDKGELMCEITTYQGRVVVNFGTPVGSLAMRPKEARLFATLLRRYANKVTKR